MGKEDDKIRRHGVNNKRLRRECRQNIKSEWSVWKKYIEHTETKWRPNHKYKACKDENEGWKSHDYQEMMSSLKRELEKTKGDVGSGLWNQRWFESIEKYNIYYNKWSQCKLDLVITISLSSSNSWLCLNSLGYYLLLLVCSLHVICLERE